MTAMLFVHVYASIGSSPPVMDLGADAVVVDGLDGVELVAGEWWQCGGGCVLPGLVWVSGSGDDGGHAGLLDDPGQGGLSGGGSGRRQRGELAGRFHAGVEVDAGERLAGVECLAVPVVAAGIVRAEDRVMGV